MFPTGLYAICDDAVRTELSLEQKAADLLAGGARVIQLRMKRTGSVQALQMARRIVALCRQGKAVCLVNDRVDWALMSQADGVHLGADDLSVSQARQLLGPGRFVGATVRSLKMIREAQTAGADHVGLGPIFNSSTKRVEAPPLGLSRLREIVAHSPLPVIAISGIDRGNIQEVAATGVHGAAVLSELLNATDIRSAARELTIAFQRGSSQ